MKKNPCLKKVILFFTAIVLVITVCSSFPQVALKVNASSPIYAVNTYVLPQNNDNWAASAWDANSGSGVFFDSPSAGQIAVARQGHIYYNADTLQNKLAQFDFKVNSGSDLNNGWAGFVLRPSDPLKLLWEQSSGYRILIFNSSFILTKIGGNDLATVVNNTAIADSNMHVIRLGTINEGSAVRIVFEIDGNIIFDYLDGDNPVMNNTSFIHGNCGDVFTTLSFPLVVPVTGVTLNKNSSLIGVGSTETLFASIAPADATNTSLIWSSSNNDVATVDESGSITAISVGTATISATTVDGGFADSCVVTVSINPYAGITYILPQNNDNWAASAWDANSGSGVFFDSPSAGQIAVARQGHIYYNADTLQNELAQFDLKVNSGSDLNNGWAGFVLRPSDTSNLLWAQSSGYLILIRNNYFVLTKIGVGDLVPNVSSSVLSDDLMHVIRLGTINENNGVRIIFEIDGNMIINYLDDDNPVMNNTSFIHGNCGEVFTTLSFPEIDPITFNKYIISGTYIYDISPETSVGDFRKEITVRNDTTIDFMDCDGNPITDDSKKIGTGTTVSEYVRGKIASTYTMVILGDVYSDGKIDLNDLVPIRNSLLGINQLEGVLAEAGDLYGEKQITLNDLVGVMSYISDNGAINQNPLGWSSSMSSVPVTSSNATFFGRTYYDNTTQSTYFNWTASGFDMTFEGNSLNMEFQSDPNYDDGNAAYITVLIDGEKDPANGLVIKISPQGGIYNVAKNLSIGKHSVKIVKRSEVGGAPLAIKKVIFPTGGKIDVPPSITANRKIEVIGDSITCGFGNAAPSADTPFSTQYEDGLQTYATIAAKDLNAQINVIAQSGWCVDKSTYGGPIPSIYDQICGINNLNTSNWDFSSYQPDVVVLNLGTNDATVVFNDTERTQFEAKYADFVTHLLTVYPNAKIICSIGSMLDSTNPVYIGIQNACNTLKTNRPQDSGRLSFLGFTNVNSIGDVRSGHPGPFTQAKNAQELETEIMRVTGWQ